MRERRGDVTRSGKRLRSSLSVSGAGMIHSATLACVGQSHDRPFHRSIVSAWTLHTAHCSFWFRSAMGRAQHAAARGIKCRVEAFRPGVENPWKYSVEK